MGNVLATIISLVNPALGILSAFTGSAKAAKASAAVQDAVGVVGALVPLIEQFTSGKEVMSEDVRKALADKDKALAEFDALIASKS